MATKAGLLATINGFITAVITQAKHRSSMSSVVDEIYPISITDNDTSQIYTEIIGGSGIIYSISIVKSGNIAHISGSFQNENTFLISNRGVFSWLNSEFKPESDTNLYFFGIDDLGNSKKIFMNNSIFSLEDSLGILGTVYFDFKTYITQD